MEIITVQHPELGTLYKAVCVTRDSEGNEITRETVANLSTLDKAKKFKCALIDEKTREVISRGFQWGGKTMSMSANAQMNWSNLKSIPDSFFPKYFMSKDDEPVMINASDKENMWLAAFACSSDAQISGGSLKMQVNELTSIEEVINFVDNR